MAEIKQPQPQQQPLPTAVKPSSEPAVPAAISKEIDELMRRLRQLEERYSGLRKKSQLIEQNMLKDTKDIFEEISLSRQTITELKLEISELAEKLLKLADEVSSSVSKSEFNVVSKYLDFWQPLDFLTRDEAMKLLGQMKSDAKEKPK
jgi:uncharacterized protein YoxC